jgi:hypothetical protein
MRSEWHRPALNRQVGVPSFDRQLTSGGACPPGHRSTSSRSLRSGAPHRRNHRVINHQPSGSPAEPGAAQSCHSHGRSFIKSLPARTYSTEKPARVHLVCQCTAKPGLVPQPVAPVISRFWALRSQSPPMPPPGERDQGIGWRANQYPRHRRYSP